MVRAAVSGELEGVETREEPFFGLQVPLGVPGVPANLLDPRSTWADKGAYDEQVGRLARLFGENFAKFEGEASEEVREAGPKGATAGSAATA
jgi:phosphoenolpyruvate carboxykinase (ATP)